MSRCAICHEGAVERGTTTATFEAEGTTIVIRTPDLVLLDINMPGMNGLEVMKHIDRQIAVIMITGNVDSAPAEALKLGAFAYIPKPFDLAYVEQLVPLALMRRRPPKARIAENV